MTPAEFFTSLSESTPPAGLTPALIALWWDGKGDWARAHDLINDMETPDTMAVHAYLHRKEGEQWNADYWYRKAGSQHRRPTLEAEWQALVEALLR
ncbi:MAG TPA: hypothetical protein VG714_06995 [Acidobacteriaceae bacterium]|nr:hypothetical protein [Acidobacteriaceae bacterium]